MKAETNNVVEKFISVIAENKFPFSLMHNQHHVYYESVDDYIRDSLSCASFKDDDSKQRCINTDEVWELQWYPNSSIGFCSIAAPTLFELLQFAING